MDQFYRQNRRILTWVIFFLLLWILRGFFGLMFLTYVIAFSSGPMVRLAQQCLRLSRRLAIMLVYLVLLAGLTSFAGLVVPRVIREANALLNNLDQIESRVFEVKNRLIETYPSLGRMLSIYLRGLVKEEANADQAASGPGGRNEPLPGDEQLVHEQLVQLIVTEQGDLIRDYAPRALHTLAKGSSMMLLALLFSFLIMLDITRLGREIETLRQSRLKSFYEQTAQPVVRFAWVVGRAIQAQALIACANTVLTFIGLVTLGIPSLAVLSLIVFVCSFIPVLGVFISTVPILLVALNAGGLGKATMAAGLVVVIHAVEAYLLNPLIYGRHLKLNPVFVLIILFLGHHLFGLWGVLLGVPVAHYFIHDVFGVPIWNVDGKPPASDEPPAETTPV